MAGIIEYLADHDWSLYAAGLAFYGLISLTPFVMLAVAIGGAVFGSELARSELHQTIAASAGAPVADLVVGFAKTSTRPKCARSCAPSPIRSVGSTSSARP